ncbi:MAG: ABC transporter substrate-binding protein [Clostridia bacterium]|nr:ABC transporter substrate-binding protein [Clostridia bacterium]
MKFKSMLAFLLALVLSASLVACAPAGETQTGNTDTGVQNSNTDEAQNTFDGADVRVAALSGSTGLGMAKLMNDAEANTTVNRYTFDVFDAPETLLPEITAKKYDIAALPTNVAAKLYNKTNGELQILAVNTLGVLYMLEIGTQTVKSVADLSGKTVYTTGQGSTPEYALKYILEKNGVTDCNIVFETTADLVVSHAEEGAILMLPEPKVTAVKGQLQNVTVALDMTAEWNKVCDTPMAQGCVVVTKEFAQENPEAVAQFLKEYEASINFVKNNVEEASQMVAKFKIIPKAPLAAKAIPNSNLTFLAGSEMKTALIPFYQVLFNADASSVGGKMPVDDFYYGA